MQKIKRKNGITLVALIITIIVLLILAGVSLSFVFNGGILDKSQQAVNEYENASQKEQDLLDKIDKYLENELGEIANDEPKVPSVDENGLATEDTTIVAKDDPNIQIVIPEGFAPAILQTGTTQSLPGENGAVKEIMPAEEWNNITKEDINKGIVVVDNKITYDGGNPTGSVSDFNEYVWIPMPDMSKFTRVAWNGPYWTDKYYTGNHLLSTDIKENTFWEDNTTQEYKEILNSVNKNKGFYVSRYECTIKDSTTVQSKRNQQIGETISISEAILMSSNMKPEINSHLIYGIEWDSILQWMISSSAIISSTENGKTKKIELSDVESDSRSWGNYSNALGDAAINSGISQPTGTSEYWKVNNIYDFAGNVLELTQEKYSNNALYVCRGGYFSAVNTIYSAAYRYNSDTARGFRLGFYI